MQAHPSKKEKEGCSREVTKQFNVLCYNTGHHCMTVTKRYCSLFSKCVYSICGKCDKNKSHLGEKRDKFVSLAPLISNYLLVKIHWDFLSYTLGCLIWPLSVSSKNGGVTWYECVPDQKRERKRWLRESKKVHKTENREVRCSENQQLSSDKSDARLLFWSG